MKDSQTLSTLVKASKPKPVERPLCCPTCGMSIQLTDGRYVCGTGHSFGQLKELAVR
jgi:hypothetical protein